MNRTDWKRIHVGDSAIVSLGSVSTTFAQETLEERVQRLEKHAEKLEKQNEMLLKLLNESSSVKSRPASTNLGKEDVQQIIGNYLQDKEDQKRAIEESKKQEGFVVGDDRSLKASLGRRWFSFQDRR